MGLLSLNRTKHNQQKKTNLLRWVKYRWNGNTVRGFDFDEDGSFDYYVQAYRTNETIVGGETQSFDLGVRVYPRDAVKDDGTVITPLETDPDTSPFSTGRKNDVPVVSLYTSLYRTER